MLRFCRNLSVFSRLRASQTLIDVQANPDNYHPAITRYGWFLVPKTHYASQWTLEKLDEIISKSETIPESELPIGPNDPRYEPIQEKIDAWVESVKPNAVPKVAAKSAKERKEAEDRELYIKQSMGNIAQKKSTSVGPSTPIDRVTFTHAWNYYRSIQGIERRARGESLDPKVIAESWRAMGLHEKNQYRQQYADLLEQGKDVFRGEIVSKEYKDQMNLKKKKGRR